VAAVLGHGIKAYGPSQDRARRRPKLAAAAGGLRARAETGKIAGMAAPRSLLRLRGVVEASVDRVLPLIIDAPVDPTVVTVERDHAAGRLALQGGWWYRGETRVAPHEAGTLVSYEVFDLTGNPRWVMWPVTRKPLRMAPADFATRLAEVGTRLGCRAYPLVGEG
jgi:hypothetical protein